MQLWGLRWATVFSLQAGELGTDDTVQVLRSEKEFVRSFIDISPKA